MVDKLDTELNVNRKHFVVNAANMKQGNGAMKSLEELLWIVAYLLAPWSRVLLEKLTGSAASQEIPRIFGTRRFLTVPTSARHLSLS